jgi:hypothetical protein
LHELEQLEHDLLVALFDARARQIDIEQLVVELGLVDEHVFEMVVEVNARVELAIGHVVVFVVMQMIHYVCVLVVVVVGQVLEESLTGVEVEAVTVAHLVLS